MESLNVGEVDPFRERPFGHKAVRQLVRIDSRMHGLIMPIGINGAVTHNPLITATRALPRLRQYCTSLM